jgi:hypothetical protein
MSVIKYLELDSTYRDRNRFPFQSDFEVAVSQSGIRSRLDALDPVANSSALTTWQSRTFDLKNPGDFCVLANVIFGSSQNELIVEANPISGLHTQDGYYINAILEIDNGAGFTEPRRITEYKYLGSNRAEITLDGGIDLAINIGDLIRIDDPTELSDPLAPLFFLPGANQYGQNIFIGCLLYNDTRNEYRKIIEFANASSILRVDTSGAVTSTVSTGPVTGWTVTDIYSIRCEQPLLSGLLDGEVLTSTPFVYNPTFLSNSSFILGPGITLLDVKGCFLEIKTNTLGQISNIITAGSVFQLDPLTASCDNSSYIGCTIAILSGVEAGNIATVNGYHNKTIIGLTPPLPGLAPGDDYFILTTGCGEIEERRIVRCASGIGNILNTNGSTQFTISGNFDNLTGMYIRIYDVSAPPNYDVVLVTSDVVSGTTHTITTTPALSFVAVAGDTFELNSGIVNPPFPYPILTYDLTLGPLNTSSGPININVESTFKILCFSRDNVSPVVFSGSNASHQDSVCYEISLLSLIIPNRKLNSLYGDDLKCYPYLYLELSNTSSSGAGFKNIIYSNNINSNRMLFRVTSDKFYNKCFSKFESDGMVHIVRFKPNDCLKMSVRNPNGNILDFYIKDTTSPHIPDPSLQISAVFKLKRVDC